MDARRAARIARVSPGRGQSAGGERQRRHEETAGLIEQTALALFGAEGFGAVTCETIARAAGVSRRTFYRYFPGGKEEVVLAHLRRVLIRLPALLADRPPHESALVALRQAFLEQASDEDDRETFQVRFDIMTSVPAVGAQALGEHMRLAELLEHLVAVRLAADPSVDLRPRLIVTTVMAAFSTAVAQWVSSDVELSVLVGRALDALSPSLDSIASRDASPISQA
jgi:AcrR family transcriptional regulator